MSSNKYCETNSHYLIQLLKNKNYLVGSSVDYVLRLFYWLGHTYIISLGVTYPDEQTSL